MRTTSTDYSRPHRPPLVAAANRLGEMLSRAGFSPSELSLDELLTTARRKTGLTNLGDESILERLQVLVNSLNREARLHPTGRFMARQNLIRILENTLKISNAIRTTPEILDQEIVDPVFIVGLQRTGTTMLHRLMASDPAFRYLASWEAINPAPFSSSNPLSRWLGHRLANGKDPRVRMAEMAQRALAFLAPDFFAIHPVEAESPEEDCLLFDYGFWSTVPEATQRVPGFSAWLERQDHTPAYRSYEKVLKYLQWQRPAGRWVLKTPQHLEHLEPLLAVFPGAKVIQTHRDPCKTAASFSSMMAHAWGVFSDQVDPHEVARHWTNKARRMILRAMKVRESAPKDHFLDVSYYDLVAGPFEQIRRIYRFLGTELTHEAMTRMQMWRNANPQHKYGRHRYHLEDFGLSEAEIEHLFGSYRSRYRIPRE